MITQPFACFVTFQDAGTPQALPSCDERKPLILSLSSQTISLCTAGLIEPGRFQCARLQRCWRTWITVSRTGFGSTPCVLTSRACFKMLLSSSGSATILHKRWFSFSRYAAPDLGTAHAELQLAPSIITLVTHPKAATGLLCTPASTDLDFDRPY